MTNLDAATLLVELDAMRIARAEDHKACARLAARVKEMEAENDRLRGELQARRLQDVIGGSRLSDGHRMEALTALLEADKSKLAEGTRDEAAERCWVCGVPIPNGANRCLLHVRVNSCPPGAGVKECEVAACWKHGDIP